MSFDNGHVTAETVEAITLGGDGEVAAQFRLNTVRPNALTIVRFDATASRCSDDDRIAEYVWDFGDHATSLKNSAVSEHNFPQAGQFDVRLIVRIQRGLQAEIYKSVRVGFRLELEFEPRCPLTSSPVQLTAKAFVNLHAEDGILDYAWDFDNDGVVDRHTKEPDVRHAYQSAGTYTIRVRATSVNGIVEEATCTVTVHDPTIVPASN